MYFSLFYQDVAGAYAQRCRVLACSATTRPPPPPPPRPAPDSSHCRVPATWLPEQATWRTPCRRASRTSPSSRPPLAAARARRAAARCSRWAKQSSRASSGAPRRQCSCSPSLTGQLLFSCCSVALACGCQLVCGHKADAPLPPASVHGMVEPRSPRRRNACRFLKLALQLCQRYLTWHQSAAAARHSPAHAPPSPSPGPGGASGAATPPHDGAATPAGHHHRSASSEGPPNPGPDPHAMGAALAAGAGGGAWVSGLPLDDLVVLHLEALAVAEHVRSGFAPGFTALLGGLPPEAAEGVREGLLQLADQVQAQVRSRARGEGVWRGEGGVVAAGACRRRGALQCGRAGLVVWRRCRAAT